MAVTGQIPSYFRTFESTFFENNLLSKVTNKNNTKVIRKYDNIRRYILKRSVGQFAALQV